MNAVCKKCQNSFEITESDLKFYEKASPSFSGKKYIFPSPTLCPKCRQIRRRGQINQLNLFQRKCDFSGENMISMYPQDAPFKVYKQKNWNVNTLDATTYGRDFDFNKPFFEQFEKLRLDVPHPALSSDYLHDENCDYTNYAGKNKDCYLIFDSDENRDCYYCYGTNGSRSSMDCHRVQKMELCYECMDSKNCYNCAFLSNCETCVDSVFLNNCIGCKSCIMCSNLRQKEFFINNKPSTKEQYLEMKKKLNSYTTIEDAKKYFHTFRLKFPQKYMRGFQNENCTGDYLSHCKNAEQCFDSMNLWDGKYCTQTFIKGKDYMDADECGECEILYEDTLIGYNGFNIHFSMGCFSQINDLLYCDICFYSSNLFGCVGLERKKYCILNKQYTPEEYEKLVPKIIEHMQKTGEYGEFFPLETSPVPYNLSIIYEHFPLTKEEALKQNLNWRDEDKREYQKQTYKIPDDIKDVKETIVNEILACETCGKNFKITAAELFFYKRQGIAIPHKCFRCRNREKIVQKNKRELHPRTCDNCKKELLSTFPPKCQEIVYCEECYQKSLQ